MTHIPKAQLLLLQFLRARLKPPHDIEEYEALSTLLAIGDKLASGDWVMVPKVPTEAMIDAWSSAAPPIERVTNTDDEANQAWATADWSAMLSAVDAEPEKE